ncbi:hypothetical protein KSP39_PZI022530 [Platanthera zijinensis]|uniref:Uncharacterized protein n=1 Tax=Platanthera zijinensis TaxID=2320716 RepID=A0AAP0AUP7_9ASPA
MGSIGNDRGRVNSARPPRDKKLHTLHATGGRASRVASPRPVVTQAVPAETAHQKTRGLCASGVHTGRALEKRVGRLDKDRAGCSTWPELAQNESREGTKDGRRQLESEKKVEKLRRTFRPPEWPIPTTHVSDHTWKWLRSRRFTREHYNGWWNPLVPSMDRKAASVAE